MQQNNPASLPISAHKKVWNPKIKIWIGSILLLGSALASGNFLFAQAPPHNTLTSCQRYADQLYKQDNPENFQSLHLLESGMSEDKYEGKVGRQFISTVLSGQGIVQYKNEKPAPIHFTCLLENDQKAVFFHTTDAQKPDPAKTCWDQFRPGDWGGLQTCLKQALSTTENELKTLQEKAQTQANQVDAKWNEAHAKEKLTHSDAQWQSYRDQECERRDAFRSGGNHPDVSRLECLIHKTQERVKDLRFDEPNP